ncbi:MAG TPA: DUF3027 domain-containing protein [Arthrobacter sp.]|nr:DUF3027 domain-containing protein [Arthrobacter sp.]
MTAESDQNASPAARDRKAAGTKDGSKPRPGVPVWRTGRPDAFLAAAVDVARTALEGIAPAEQIGRHLAAKSEGDRLVTHLFESKLAGYGGWQWYAVLTRNSRSKVVTVDELGLLPSEDSILAPDWIPWAERVRPGDEQGEDELAVTAPAALAPPMPASGESDSDSAPDAMDTPEDDSDDADGNADGAGDEYDADDVDDDDAEDAVDDDDAEDPADDDGAEDDAGDAPGDEMPSAQAD